MRLRDRSAALSVTAVLLSGLAACSAGARPPRATYEPVPCPAEVEVAVVPEHSCGEVVVSADEGRDLRIFVLQVEPPRPSRRAPVLETGTDVGMTPVYGGLAPIAQRTGRRVVIVDLPGSGHSTPSLACPEVEVLQSQGLQSEGTAALTDSMVLGAVEACRDRLVRDGVDPGLGSPARLGQSLFWVAEAMGLDHVVAMGHGTTGQAAIELARSHPSLVQTLVLDSVTPTRAPRRALRAAVHRVATACRGSGECLRRYGDVADSWSRAVRLARIRPVVLELGKQRLVLDQDELARAVRWLVAPVASGPAKLPALLFEAASGRQGPLLSQYVASRLTAPPMCVGFLPKCDAGGDLATGAVFSAMCATSATEGPWHTACRAWGVNRILADAPVTGVPALALIGRYDPYVDPETARAAIRRVLPDAFVVEDPVAGHNVLGRDCMRNIRTAWLEDPSSAPPSPGCLHSLIAWY